MFNCLLKIQSITHVNNQILKLSSHIPIISLAFATQAITFCDVFCLILSNCYFQMWHILYPSRVTFIVSDAAFFSGIRLHYFVFVIACFHNNRDPLRLYSSASKVIQYAQFIKTSNGDINNPNIFFFCAVFEGEDPFSTYQILRRVFTLF